jgi:hypothetical protein
VTATPLEVWFELNEPQVPAGAQLQVTPPFAESLATVAVMACVAATCRDVGTVLSVTVMGVDEPELPELPHAASSATRVIVIRRTIAWRIFTW